MNVFKIAYDPEISHEAKNVIRDNATVIMRSIDDSTEQYSIDNVIYELKRYDDIYEKDVEYLNNLDVDYIKF